MRYAEMTPEDWISLAERVEDGPEEWKDYGPALREMAAVGLDRTPGEIVHAGLDDLGLNHWAPNDTHDPDNCQRCRVTAALEPHIAVALLASAGASSAKACPCLHTTPCSEFCTCVHPESSVGCYRCCSYGSAEQQRDHAKHLAYLADDGPDSWLPGSPCKTMDECPTYYDGCNCTAETLAHNIDRAQRAEARVKELESAGGLHEHDFLEPLPGQVVIVRSTTRYLYTARRCNGQTPCDLAIWKHDCSDWLLFDQSDGTYHAVVDDEEFRRDFEPAAS